jgi:predicted transcriptional regulator
MKKNLFLFVLCILLSFNAIAGYLIKGVYTIDVPDLKNISSNTFYQIYNVTGQLVQSGTTNPDISTVKLCKGMYILRLESGKAYKFVK